MHSGSMDQWFDAACRMTGPAHWGRAQQPIRGVVRLNRSTRYAFRRTPGGLGLLRTMTASAVANKAG